MGEDDIMRKVDKVEKTNNSLPAIILKKIVATMFGACFIFFLLINRCSSWLLRNLVFLHAVRWPLYRNFNEPKLCGIKGARNFQLISKENIKIGVWQILPVSLVKETNDAETFEEALGDGKPIIVYVHGNSGTRASPHRVLLYVLLQSMNIHIVTFDYRSYGDSTAVSPDEVGVVEDTITVLRWVFSQKKSSPIYVWGHSLGTGISSRAVTEMEKRGNQIDGLILESPFNCFKDAVALYPLTALFRHMIGFEYFIIEPIMKHGITFKTEEYLSNSSIPILILHAVDDIIVPIPLGKKLHHYLLKNRADAEKKIKFVQFSSKNRYGHKYICECPKLPGIVSAFMSQKWEQIPSNVD